MVGWIPGRRPWKETVPRAQGERLAPGGHRYEGRSRGKGDVSTEPGNSDSFDFLLEIDIQATREE